MERPNGALHTESSLALLVAAAVGAGLVLALAAAVAGAGLGISVLAFCATAAFGLAADGRSEAVARRLRRR